MCHVRARGAAIACAVGMPKRIDHDTLQRLVREGAVLLEVLDREQYEDEHLPGAINIPLDELDARSTRDLRRDTPVITYCWDFQ